jgi:hypothetical protein
MFSSNTTQVSDGGYQISRSLRFNSADSAYLNRTPASAGNRRTFTWSGWVKRSTLGVDYATLFGVTNAGNDSSWNALIFYSDGLGFQTWNNVYRRTTQVLRDTSAWYHVVLAVDTTQATASDRIKLYLNGSQITAFSTSSDPSQNTDLPINNSVAHTIGRDTQQSTNFGGYMTEVNFIDGQALTPSSFGETDTQTGVWKPKAYSGSYGTNGFYLNFSDNSNTTAATLGADYSGNGNNWTPNGFLVSAGAGNDSLVDVPTPYGVDTGVGGSVRGNYATWNSVGVSGGGTTTITNGNLDTSVGSTTTFGRVSATFGLSTGKWYWEMLIVDVGGGANVGISVGGLPSGSYGLGGDTGEVSYQATGNKYLSGSISAYGSTYAANDIIGVAYDADAGSITFYKNNTSQGAITGFTGTKYPAVGAGGGTNPQYTANFGQRPFAYTAPSGFKALCTQNLPTPTIGATTATQAGKYFNTVLYTGNSSTLSVTGVGFQPDWIWGKCRSTALSHRFFDAVRGVTSRLSSNLTAAETTESGVTAFNSDGFTLGSDQGLNFASDTYVAWNWKANGAGSSNTAGSITSTVSANTTSGFSIVTYTGNATSGATVGHGLGVAPSMIILKIRSTTGDWPVYHVSNGNTIAQYLNLSLGTGGAFAGAWNNTTPTSTVFTLGNSTETNASGGTFVAYCFAPVAGYSSFGQYTGNGSTDGPFVFTGFRPAYVMVKTSGDNVWLILDATRNTSNVVTLNLNANQSSAENTYSGWCDFTSNGFKVRGTDGAINTGSGLYIYMAFASSPFKYSLAR